MGIDLFPALPGILWLTQLLFMSQIDKNLLCMGMVNLTMDDMKGQKLWSSSVWSNEMVTLHGKIMLPSPAAATHCC